MSLFPSLRSCCDQVCSKFASLAHGAESEAALVARAKEAPAQFVGQQAVQLHGGMGMTEELAIGHYFKRLTALQFEFGSTDHHVSRYAQASVAG